MATITYLCLTFVSASLFLSDIHSVESTPMSQLRTDDNTTDKCNDLMDEFASRSSKFGLCAVTHARPIKICQKCVNQYQNITNIYHAILTSNNTEGEKCEDILLNADRLGILRQMFINIVALWTQGHCDSCYVVNETTGDYKLSNYTERFITLQSIAMACIRNDTQGTTKINNTICQDCEADYCNLNTFYNQLKDSFDEDICIDIVDTMNKTRNLWSGELKCITWRRTKDVPLIITSILVSLIPVIFYMGAKIFSSQRRNQLQAQKRLAEHVTNEEENNKPCTSNN